MAEKPTPLRPREPETRPERPAEARAERPPGAFPRLRMRRNRRHAWSRALGQAGGDSVRTGCPGHVGKEAHMRAR